MGFHGVMVEEVSLLISKSLNKQCELDPIPTWIVKELIDVLAPTIRDMADAYFGYGQWRCQNVSAAGAQPGHQNLDCGSGPLYLQNKICVPYLVISRRGLLLVL